MLLCMGPPGGNRQSFGTVEGFYINRYVFPLLSQQHGCPLSPFGAGGHSCLYRELYKMVSAAPFLVWMWYNVSTWRMRAKAKEALSATDTTPLTRPSQKARGEFREFGIIIMYT